jgi:hypothetical protein
LYSSTACVLEWLTHHLRPGSLIYFDDLLDPDDEMRALREWLDASDNRATAVAMARWGQHMLFEWRGPRQAATDRPAAPQPPHHFAGLPGQPTAGLPGRSTATPSGRSTAELPGQAAPAPSTVDGR